MDLTRLELVNLLLAKQLRYQIAPQAHNIFVDTYRSRTDITGLRSQGSTIELMTQILVDTYGIRTYDIFSAGETFYQLN